MNIDKEHIKYNSCERKYMKIKYFEFDKAQKYLKEGKISNHNKIRQEAAACSRAEECFFLFYFFSKIG